eukprot:GSChrysophyteH1.ASY1.ANO1.133.1 assembled CDS
MSKPLHGTFQKVSVELTHHPENGKQSSKSHKQGKLIMAIMFQEVTSQTTATSQPVKVADAPDKTESSMEGGPREPENSDAGMLKPEDMIAGHGDEQVNNRKAIGSNIKKEVGRKLNADFEHGCLRIQKIVLADLNSSGKTTFASLELSNSLETFETEPKPKSGQNKCEYSYIDTKMNVERYHIHEGKMVVRLYECNKWNPLKPSKVALGVAEISLDPLLLRVYQECNLAAEFLSIDGKSQVVGRISVDFKLDQWNDVKEETAVEKGLANGGMLEIKSIQITDMQYAHATFSSEVKRPFAVFHYGNGPPCTTNKEEVPKLGAVQWNNLNYEYFDLTSEKLRDCKLSLELWDRGVMRNSLVGTCEISLSKALLNEDFLVKGDIRNDNAIVGSLCVVLQVADQLTNAQKKSLAIQKVSPDSLKEKEELLRRKEMERQSAIDAFVSGTFQIKSIDCKDMIAVELGAFLGDKNDPYVKVSYGKWSQATEYIDGGGSDANWDDLYYEVSVTKDSLTTVPLSIEVWDHNKSADTFIGKTSVLLSDYALEFDDDGDESTVNTNAGFKLRSQLKCKDGQKDAGVILLECMMKPSKEELDALVSTLEVSQGVEKGIISISKMKASMLSRDGKVANVMHPYVSIDYCDNTGLGLTTEEAHLEPAAPKALPQQFSNVGQGPNAVFNAFHYTQRVTRKQCEQESMHIYIKENDSKDVHNTNLDDTIVGEGYLKDLLIVGSQVGKEIEVTVDLYAPGTDFSKPLTDSPSYGSIILFVTFQDTTGKIDYVKASPRIDGEIVGEHGADANLALFGEEGAYFMVSYFQSKGLQTNGSPVVSFKIEGDESSKETLPVLRSSNQNKGDLHWDYKTRIHLTPDVLKTKALEVTVTDQHYVSANSLVGTGSTKLNFFYKKSRINKMIDLSIDLRNGTGQPTGRIVVGCELRPSVEDQKKHTLPDNFKGGVIHIPKIQTHNLKNTEFIGQADPYIIIKDTEGTEIGRTYIATDMGGSVLFDHLDIRTKQDVLFQANDLRDKSFVIEAWDDNVGFDKLIGSGLLQLDDLIGPYDQEVEMRSLHLTDKSGNLTGRVDCFGILEQPPPPKDAPLELPEKFEKATARITSIAAFGIENKNMLGFLNKADPYLELGLFDESGITGSPIWTGHTAAKMDAGEHALFNYLDLEFPVNKTLLERGTLQVVAKDKNIRKEDAFIGCGTCSLRRAAASIQVDEKTGDLSDSGKTVELSLDLNCDAPGKLGKKSHGRLTIYIEIAKEQPDESTLHHKPDFEYGILRISKICTFDLKNVEMFSKWTDSRQDPFIKVAFGAWTEQTHVQENMGSDVTWDFLTMERPLYTEDILQNRLRIEAWEHNHVLKHKLIGTGEVRIIKGVTTEAIGKEVKLSVKLEDDNHNPTGRADVYLTVTEPEIGGEIPADFELGILTIKRATIIGASARKPSLKFSLNEQKETTEKFGIHSGEDSSQDPVWDMNFKFHCDQQDARGKSDLLITVMTSSTFGPGSESEYGEAKIQLRDAALSMHKVCELRGVIFDKSEKRLGRIVLQARLSNDVVKSLPITDCLPEEFLVGSIHMKKLKLQVDYGIFHGKKLYCRLEYGDWKENTEDKSVEKLQKRGKTTIAQAMIWEPDTYIEVNKEILGRDKLKVVVLETSLFGTKEIAHGVTGDSKIIKDLCQNLNEDIECNFNLVSATNHENQIVGKATLNAMLTDQDMSPDNDDGQPASVITYDEAELQILKCSAFDLVGGDMIGKEDPYIIFKIDNIKGEGVPWIQQTDCKEGAGSTAVWDLSDGSISTPITGDALRYQRLQVLAIDKNKLTKDTFIGEGYIGLRGAGAVPDEDKLLKIKLIDKTKKKYAGRIELMVNVNRSVNMATGKDEDGDGIDDGLQATKMNGTLQFNNVSFKRVGGYPSDRLYVLFKMHEWEKHTEFETDRFKEKEWRWDPINITSKKVSTAQLLHEGVDIQVYQSRGQNPSPKNDKLIAELFRFSCKPALNALGEFRDIKGDAHIDGNMVGKITVGTKFTPDNVENINKQQEAIQKQHVQKPRGGDQATPKTKGSPRTPGTDVDHKAMLSSEVSSMEKHLKAQLKSLVSSQTEELKKSIEELERQQRKARTTPAAPKEKWDIFNVTNVQLPANVHDWRVAHVQAWLAFQVELPMYMEAFKQASIDGPMLLKKVDETTLPKLLSCTNELHKAKIMDAVEELKERMAEVVRVEKENERAQKRLEKAKHKKNKIKTTKIHVKHAKKKSKLQVEEEKKFGKGVASEEAQINRVKMERAARLALEKSKAKMNAKSSTWKFEYTGTPKPQNGGIWDDETFQTGEHPELGTKAFQDAMESMDILDDGLQRGTYRKMTTNNRARKLRIMPSNSSGDEILAAIKEAMFALSNRLLQIQSYTAKKLENNDEDLDSVDYSPPGGDEGAPADSDADKGWMAPPVDDEYEDEGDEIDYTSNLVPNPNAPDLWTHPSASSPKATHKRMVLVKKEKKEHKRSPDKELHKDRVALVYNALVEQHNNDASFIGDNDKLTRLKLFGGCESMLRLRLTWPQFDSLWTRMDSFRTGDLDLKEFKAFFGDLSEFETDAGIQGLTTVGDISSDMKMLTKVLYQLCDVMRHAGFTVAEMFSSFDRDGSGSVSINEFCSMLRLIVGPTFDKKMIYRSLLVLDTDRNKSISREEFYTFVYKTWKQQMEDLDYRRCCLDENKSTDIERIAEIHKERDLIKSAIKKNFPRELRNALEAAGTTLAGPFATMFKDDINEGQANASGKDANTESMKSLHSSHGRSASASPLRSRASAGRPHSPQKIDNSGQIMRFRIRPPGAQSPTRDGEALQLPRIYNMSKSVEGLTSSEATKAMLGESAPLGLC